MITQRLTLFVLLALLAWAPAAFAQNEMQTILDAHNADRAKHCVPPLTWSPEVAATAQIWANHCDFNHDRNNNDLGENLAWGYPHLSAGESVRMWYDEISEYDYNHPGFGPAGHFTQLIWRGSRQLGCAKAICGRYTYWVCRYYPAGNYEGEYRANVSPPCR
jgi:uncharacterized protein YkwD